VGRKKKDTRYFTEETEAAIIAYNNSTSERERNMLFRDHIYYSFYKLAENVLNTWKFTYFDDDKEDTKQEVISFLLEKIHKYQQDKGKAFSYFTIAVRNYLILNNNSNYKRYKSTSKISEMPENWNPENDFKETTHNEEFKIFNDRMLQYWDENLNRIFTKKRDIQIADSILELFRRAEYIESFNKKSLYLLVREMTGHKTHYITKVVAKMKETQVKLYDQFLDDGDISDGENDPFWAKTIKR
jgi:hypothetical protein